MSTFTLSDGEEDNNQNIPKPKAADDDSLEFKIEEVRSDNTDSDEFIVSELSNYIDNDSTDEVSEKINHVTDDDEFGTFQDSSRK